MTQKQFCHILYVVNARVFLTLAEAVGQQCLHCHWFLPGVGKAQTAFLSVELLAWIIFMCAVCGCTSGHVDTYQAQAHDILDPFGALGM